jgi:N-acetyl-alpha-D-glucosaminyl L-malate synthase BshA
MTDATKERPLRIGIACYPTVGGSGILATELGLGLARRGHDVHFLAYAPPPRLTPSPNIHVHLVTVSAYPLFKFPPYDLALTSKMRDVLEREKLDILHVHYAIPHAICAYLAREMLPGCKAKTVVTLHGTDITVVGADPSYRVVTCFGLEHSDCIVAVSSYLAAETRRNFDTTKDIEVVPNFVDTSRFHPREGAQLPAVPIVAHLSNFRPVKRPRDVVKAFARIRAERAARLWLIGDGPELKDCLELAHELGVAADTESLGVIHRVEEVLRDAHLLLQPSGSEAFGLAALEAMSCGLPVVGYRVGGLPEVIDHGVTGYLVPFQDTQALADRALEILGSHETWSRFGAAGRRRALAEFSMERSVERHEEIYRRLLAPSC